MSHHISVRNVFSLDGWMNEFVTYATVIFGNVRFNRCLKFQNTSYNAHHYVYVISLPRLLHLFLLIQFFVFVECPSCRLIQVHACWDALLCERVQKYENVAYPSTFSCDFGGRSVPSTMHVSLQSSLLIRYSVRWRLTRISGGCSTAEVTQSFHVHALSKLLIKSGWSKIVFIMYLPASYGVNSRGLAIACGQVIGFSRLLTSRESSMSEPPDDARSTTRLWDKRLVSVSRSLALSAVAANWISVVLDPPIPTWFVFISLVMIVIIEREIETSHLRLFNWNLRGNFAQGPATTCGR